MTIASHEQQRDAVEAWARARGFWSYHNNPAPRGWRVSVSDDTRVALLLLQPPSIHEPAPYWTVPMPVALAWALLVELDAGSVDAGKCPACVKKFRLEPGADIWKSTVRPCVACKDSRRGTIPIARALLGDDAKVRACLHAEADRLLAANDPVGMALAWGLRWSEGDGNEDGTGEAVMLLHWLRVAREQAEQRDLMEQWAALLAMGTVHPRPDTIVLSPEAYNALTNTWTLTITPTEDPAEIVTITTGLSVVDAIRPAIEAIGAAFPMPAEIPEHIERARPKHARHIGQQLGRRLGVRAR
jgi:hypothetical protein